MATDKLPPSLANLDTGKQALELAQLVQNVVSAKRALVKRSNDDTRELFAAIDKLAEFYKT